MFIFSLFMCVPMSVHVHMGIDIPPEEGSGAPRNAVIGNCELADMNTGH